MLQNSQVVKSAVLLDPVCFLLTKHDILSNVLYREHNNPLMVALTYFVFRELYIAHTLMRNLFWQQAELPLESMSCPVLVLLSGKDAIVPAHSVRRLLRSEQVRRDELKFKRASGNRDVPYSASSVDLVGSKALHESASMVASATLKLMWLPDLLHTEFVASHEHRFAVVQGVAALAREAEGIH
jgi:hypothetical protein